MKTEREKREEERRRSKERRRQRIEKHRRIQEAWVTLRWISEYIEENEEIWEIEKLESKVKLRESQNEWEKAKRFEKIAFIKERERKLKNGEVDEVIEEDHNWCWTKWRTTKDHDREEDSWPQDSTNFTFTDTD